MSVEPAFFGRGWAFSPAFSEGGAEVQTVSGADDVHQSLMLRFATDPGERPMRETYGAGLHRVTAAEVDPTLVGNPRLPISDAVLQHEHARHAESRALGT